MLRSFGFILHVEHPHKFVLNYLVVLEQQEDPESGLLQRAWNLTNDRFVAVAHIGFDAPGLSLLLHCFAVSFSRLYNTV